MFGPFTQYFSPSSFDFGDLRLNARASKIVDTFSKADLQKGFPRIFEDAAALKAFYRFVNNSRVQMSSIIAGNLEGLTDYFNSLLAKEEDQATPALLLPCYQDTTFVDYTNRFHVKLGHTQSRSERENSALLHTMIMCNQHGTPVGVIHQDLFVREHASKVEVPHHQRPLIERESYKWVRGLERLQQWAVQLERPVQVVVIADREADSVEIMEAHRQRGLDFIIRCKSNRNVEEASSFSKLHEVMRHDDSLQQTVQRRRLHSRQADCYYEAECLVRYGTVKLVGGQQLGVIYLHEQLESRDSKKPTEPAAEWFLVTSLPLEDHQQAIRYLNLYTQRWPITEDFHKVLKTGARLEQRQLESVEGLANACALLSLTAVRILGLRYLADQEPDTPVSQTAWGKEKRIEEVMDKLDKKYLKPRDRDFSRPRTVLRLVQIMARMGGHLGYAQKGRPGWQTLWLGHQDVSRILAILEEF